MLLDIIYVIAIIVAIAILSVALTILLFRSTKVEIESEEKENFKHLGQKGLHLRLVSVRNWKNKF